MTVAYVMFCFASGEKVKKEEANGEDYIPSSQ